MSAIPLAFVLPALIYIKLIDGPFLSGRKLRAFGLAVFGVIVAIIGCIMLLTRWSKYASCDQGREPFYCERLRDVDST